MEHTSINGHTLICGDVFEALIKYVENNSVNLIFIDPPYNIGKKFRSTNDKVEY